MPVFVCWRITWPVSDCSTVVGPGYLELESVIPDDNVQQYTLKGLTNNWKKKGGNYIKRCIIRTSYIVYIYI